MTDPTPEERSIKLGDRLGLDRNRGLIADEIKAAEDAVHAQYRDQIQSMTETIESYGNSLDCWADQVSGPWIRFFDGSSQVGPVEFGNWLRRELSHLGNQGRFPVG